MIYYSNGCSHTEDFPFQTPSYIDIVADVLFEGQEFETHIVTYDIVSNSFKKIVDNSNRKFSLTNGDSKIKVIKNAKSSKSNDLIFYETVNFIYEMVNQNEKIDFISVQLSGVNRRFFFDIYGNIMNITPHDNVNMGVKFEPFATEHTLQYIILLQNLFEKFDINYCFIPYMELDCDVYQNSNLSTHINTEKFTSTIDVGHRDSFRRDGLARDEQGHPNCKGYYELAKKTLNILLGDDYQIKPIEYYFSESDFNYIKQTNQNLIQKNYKKLGDATNDILKKINNLI